MRDGGQLDKDGNYLVCMESKRNEDGSYTHGCGEILQGATIAHPIWFKEFNCAGGGECRYETIPYCPKCEKKPNYNGVPIKI